MASEQSRRRRYASERGQTMVELALVVPVLLVLLFGIFEFGKLFDYKIQMTQAARDGARWAVVNVNPGPETTLAASIKSGLDTAELRDLARVCVEASPADVGDPVTVTVRLEDYRVLPFLDLIGPNSLTTLTIESKVQMRLEQEITSGSEAASLLGCTS